MKLFAEWFYRACSEIGVVKVVRPSSIFLNRLTADSRFAKWFGYVDQFVLFAVELAGRQAFYDVVIVSDHSNAPMAALVPGRKMLVMVHDTIAIRQALGRLPGKPKAKFSGQLLQKAILAVLRRCSGLLTNPQPVPNELHDLGVDTPVRVVGCPFDSRRLHSLGTSELIDGRYVLHVGSDNYRKRKAELIEFWREVEKRDSSLKLVLAGNTEPRTVELIKRFALGSVVILNAVDDTALASLYRSCEALLVPSESEGFCIPVLEAIAFEKRVFTPTDVSFFTTVFGSAVEPCLDLHGKDVDFFVRCLAAGTSAECLEQGQKILRHYSWDQFVERVVDAIRSRAPISTEARCSL
ncbi:hypothetical protein ACM43_04895 [Bradyrhizobium sp. CCBAU 45321]|nr:hypothetical protein [Bradyrhizobium sp. CCBAU 45321]